MKKGRHRRYEEARALKRSHNGDDIESLMDRLDEDPFNLPSTTKSDSGYDDSVEEDGYDDVVEEEEDGYDALDDSDELGK